VSKKVSKLYKIPKKKDKKWKCIVHRTNDVIITDDGTEICRICYKSNPYYNPRGRIVDEFIVEPKDGEEVTLRLVDRTVSTGGEQEVDQFMGIKRVFHNSYRDLSMALRKFDELRIKMLNDQIPRDRRDRRTVALTAEARPREIRRPRALTRLPTPSNEVISRAVDVPEAEIVSDETVLTPSSVPSIEDLEGILNDPNLSSTLARAQNLSDGAIRIASNNEALVNCNTHQRSQLRFRPLWVIGASYQLTSINNISFQNSDFRNCTLTDCDLLDCLIDGCSLLRCNIVRSDLAENAINFCRVVDSGSEDMIREANEVLNETVFS